MGLTGQRAVVAGYVKGVLLGEFTEVELGKNNQRVQLAAAINQAKRAGATLVIAKLDHIGGSALEW